MDRGVSTEDELVANVRQVLALAMNAQWMLENKQWKHLNNQLTRIERTAREASYCIFDMGDLIG